ncbi:RimK family alpha-L-glutamate ligase [Thalassotalea aquiviva]|uniref:ATP-grasp domain-containing protein n=1 Tax=Thalassotalea aquiviva TaxID=3242415 RepID=UPI00352BA2C7
MKHCAILSMDCLDDFEVYDHLLDQPMLAHGWQTHLVSWRDRSIHWDDFDVVLIRTPWDYQDDAEAFLAVLENIEASSAKLYNSLEMVKWNINKKYLQELEQKGVCIVPTLWFEAYSEQDIESWFDHFNTDQIVIKPCVSANADNTYWLTRANVNQHLDAIKAVFASRDFMVQPFMQNILEEGEYSCFYFNGQYSHSILKTPKENDFRVQEEHGGKLTTVEPELKLKQAAEHALQQLFEMPMYVRVDYVRMGDEFAMMEAELIEPSLYFNMDESSALKFTQAFVAKMGES